jgi:hypothetical protein
MNSYTITFAEMEAQAIYEKYKGYSSTTINPKEGANYILALAERIKNERIDCILNKA